MSEQQNFFDKGEAWEDTWEGMPEFVQEDQSPHQSILVHFASIEDRQKFSELIDQTITIKTQSVWYPAAEIGTYADKRYIDEGSQ